MKIEYRVRPVTRYAVTRWHEADDGHTGGCEQKGEYDSADMAHEIAYALCKHEHRESGEPPGSMNFIYPSFPCVVEQDERAIERVD